jgi:WD40 repeat protein
MQLVLLLMFCGMVVSLDRGDRRGHDMSQRQVPQESSAARRTAIINWAVVASTLIVVVVLLAVSLYFLMTQGLSEGQTIVLIIATMVSTVVGLLSALLNFFQWRATEVLSDAPPDTLFTSTTPGRKSAEAANAAMSTNIAATSQGGSRHIDWGEAPVVEQFYGREQELARLLQWLQQDHCRVVAIQGIGGMGKTALARMLVEQISQEFDYVFWRSLQNAPPLTDILEQCLRALMGYQQTIHLPQHSDAQILLLIEHLRAHRCLLVLDNFESVLQGGNRVGTYLPGYQEFGRLLELIGATEHRSCLLLTSREKPHELALLEGKFLAVRSLPLYGVEQAEGQKMLQNSGLFGSRETWHTFITYYSGNPLALKLVSEPVYELFQGDIAVFLEQKDGMINNVQDLLTQQFQRLSELEQIILHWLAIEREAVSLNELHADMLPAPSKGELLEALNSLRRRSMIESSSTARFSLQPVILEYVANRFIQHIVQEIATETGSLLESHALIKAQAKDYTRQSQARLILGPVAERLLALLGSNGSEQRLRRRCSELRGVEYPRPGYAIGNILNLLLHMEIDLRGKDFSHLEIRQAYLQGAALSDINFAHTHFSNCVFTETFGRVLSLALSPDQTLLAAGTASGDVELWQLPDGTPYRTLKGHSDWIRSLAFTSDGLLASGSDDATIRIWDIHTGTCLQTLQGHLGRVYSVAWSSDNRLVASGGDDQSIRLWDSASGQCLKILQGNEGRIRALAFHPGAELLACGGVNHVIALWDIAAERIVHRLQGHDDHVYTVAFNSEGSMLASGSDDQTVRLWEVSTGQQGAVLRGHTGRVQALAFHPDGGVLASGSIDQSVRLWDVIGGRCLKTLLGHSNGVRGVVFSQDGQWIASGGQDQTVRLWEVSTGQCLKTLLGHSRWVYSVAYNPDGTLLANDYEDQSIHLWDTASGQQVKILQGHTSWVYAVAFDNSGSLLASGSDDQTVRLWDINSGQCSKVLTGHSGRVRSVAISPSGQLLASGGDDQTVRVWDRTSGKCIRVLKKHEDRVRAISFSKDGALLASTGEDGMILLWDMRTGQCRHMLRGHVGRAWSIAFNADSTLLASGGDDGYLRVWRIDTEQCVHILEGHSARIYSVAFSPDGRWLASGSEDQALRQWEVSTGKCLQVLTGHKSRIRAVAFHPNGQTLASGSQDGTIRIWDGQRGVCLRVLSNDKPYERMDITGVTGITEAQKAMLLELGAVEHQHACSAC